MRGFLARSGGEFVSLSRARGASRSSPRACEVEPEPASAHCRRFEERAAGSGPNASGSFVGGATPRVSASDEQRGRRALQSADDDGSFMVSHIILTTGGCVCGVAGAASSGRGESIDTRPDCRDVESAELRKAGLTGK